MTNPLHQTASYGEVHSPVNWTFTTDTNRRANGPYVLTDLGSECMQTDTSPPTFWKLVAIASPGLTATPTWRQITTVADSLFSGDFGSLFTGVLHYVRSDLGITQTSGNITQWNDQSGGSHHVTPATGSTYIGTVATGLNGHASVLGDGSTHGGQFTIAMAIPCFVWAVWRLVSNTGATGYLTTFDGGEMGMQINAPNNLAANNGTFIGPVNPVAGTWGRSEAAFAHASTDYIKFGSSVVTGDTGNSARTGARGVFCRPTGFAKINAELLAMVHLNNIPTTGQLAAASAAATSFYGGTVAV